MSVEERQRCVWPETAEVEGGRSGDVRETTLACRNNCRVLAARKILRDITNDLTKVGLSGSFRVAARNCGPGRRRRASSNARYGNDNLRSEERRVWEGGVSTCRSRWSPTT